MTPEQMMQVIVEAVGEYWHEVNQTEFGYYCKKCNYGFYAESLHCHINPKPTDLNELFRLAEKLEINVILKHRIKDYHTKIWFSPGDDEGNRVFFWAHAITTSESLLLALYASTKKEE